MLGKLINFFQTATSLGESSYNLENQNGASDTSSADFPSFFSAYADIIANSVKLSVHAGSFGLLGGHAEVQDISGVIEGHNCNTLLSGHSREGSSADLFGQKPKMASK